MIPSYTSREGRSYNISLTHAIPFIYNSSTEKIFCNVQPNTFYVTLVDDMTKQKIYPRRCHPLNTLNTSIRSYSFLVWLITIVKNLVSYLRSNQKRQNQKWSGRRRAGAAASLHNANVTCDTPYVVWHVCMQSSHISQHVLVCWQIVSGPAI